MYLMEAGCQCVSKCNSNLDCLFFSVRGHLPEMIYAFEKSAKQYERTYPFLQ